MKKFKYLTKQSHEINWNGNINNNLPSLNDLGFEGWELINVVNLQSLKRKSNDYSVLNSVDNQEIINKYIYYFKKEI